MAVACLVLYHGDRPWNAPTRLHHLFRDSAPEAYRVVSPRPPEAPPPTPLDLPRMLLGLVGASTAREMRAGLRVLQRVVRDCRDDDLDRFLSRAVKAMLRSKGMSSEHLEEARTMQTVATAFQRSLDEIRREGREQGIRQGREQGIRQGHEQGIRQGREQGIRRGREQGMELGRVSVLRQLAARKFGSAAAEELASELEGTPNPKQVARATEALLDCDTADDFLNRVREG